MRNDLPLRFSVLFALNRLVQYSFSDRVVTVGNKNLLCTEPLYRNYTAAATATVRCVIFKYFL